MTSVSSTLESAEEVLCRIHQVLSDADSESLVDAQKRAQERHERRLARIVADQWMHVARERLTVAWCAQMVHCWRKICAQRRWNRQQSFLASEHYTHKKYLDAFNALREGGQSRQANQFVARNRSRKTLGKKALRGLSATQVIAKEHSRQRMLMKYLRALKRICEIQRMEEDMYDGAQTFYGTSLKKQVLKGFSIHRENLYRKHAHEDSASNHWKRITGANIMRNWALLAERLATERKLGDGLRALRIKTLLSRCIGMWHSLAKTIGVERKEKIAEASQLWDRLSNLRQGRVWKAWVQLQKEKNLRHLEVKRADEMYRGLKTSAVTSAWRKYVKEKEDYRERSIEALNHWKKQSLRTAIAIWQAFKADKKRGEAAALKALAHLRRILIRKSLDAWRPWHARHTAKERDLKKAVLIYKSRLQLWGCERIYAVGLMLQALRLQSRIERQPKLAVLTFLKVAPYARKWWFLSKKNGKLKKEVNDVHKEDSSRQVLQQLEVPLLINKEPITHEVLLRIGISSNSLQRNPLEEVMSSGRALPRGRMLLPPSPIKTETSGLSRPGVRIRPPPRRPTFLSKYSSTSVTAPGISTSGQ